MKSSFISFSFSISFPLHRIVLIGASGCGKTTLGHQLSKIMGIKCIDLDELYWLPSWKKREDEEFFTQIEKELLDKRWIVCGNYTRAQQQIWAQADTIIWLDLPFKKDHPLSAGYQSPKDNERSS